MYATSPGRVVGLEDIAVSDIAAAGWHSLAITTSGGTSQLVICTPLACLINISRPLCIIPMLQPWIVPALYVCTPDEAQAWHLVCYSIQPQHMCALQDTSPNGICNKDTLYEV